LPVIAACKAASLMSLSLTGDSSTATRAEACDGGCGGASGGAAETDAAGVPAAAVFSSVTM